ncbi:hypothetical protein HAZT_HAZT008269 [Hyalella azteca]|uniref:Ig-like domain-containing protein n=1 Tax=Hyalella azteca TaxID=294128 RepID=A0A6A0HE16_HYAAZ|nr:hypothetical protein HAZT_HAZT008269 [Hyalella azteca]
MDKKCIAVLPCPGPVAEVTAVAGGNAALPCAVDGGRDDQTIMVLFYRGHSGTPIYRRVSEPPRSVKIFEEGVPTPRGSSGGSVGLVGPYMEGDVVSLRCEVLGGIPYPAVSWWYRGVPVPSSGTSRKGEVSSTSLDLPSLARRDLKSEVMCQALNTNTTEPLSASVLIDITCA